MPVQRENGKRYFQTAAGARLELVTIPEMALTALRKQVTPPKPPIGLDGQPALNDPGYLQALDDHQGHLQEIIQAAMVELGIAEVEIDQGAVNRLREAMRRPPLRAELNESDKVVYVTMVLCPTEAEVTDLYNALLEDKVMAQAQAAPPVTSVPPVMQVPGIVALQPQG